MRRSFGRLHLRSRGLQRLAAAFGEAPHKRAGKTTLFTALFRLVAKPRGASGITPSALLRLIELHHPTMLIDEIDVLMAADREMSQALRGLMNLGFNRRFANFTMNAPVRERGYEPREFSTWTPLALAGIGDLPDTVRERSIEIEMEAQTVDREGEAAAKERRRGSLSGRSETFSLDVRQF